MVKQLQLIRPVNLIMVALTMCFMRYSIIIPFLEALSNMLEVDLHSQMSNFQFALLVLSVLLITAGGYVFNDVMDVNIDRINAPERPMVKLNLSVKKYTTVAYILFGAGTILGLVMAIQAGNMFLAMFHLVAVASLYVYSIAYKRSFLLGNLIITFLAALVPLIVGLFEVTQLQLSYVSELKRFEDFNFNFLAYWIIGFAVFAAILTLAREITKDAEDALGDKQFGAQTLPIKFGIPVTKGVITAVYVGFLAALWHVQYHYLPDQYTFIYCIVLSALTLGLIASTFMAKDAKGFHWASTFNKLVSFIGLCYALLVWYMIDSGQIFAQ
tara:strand:- start:208 stop:1188 length:981 start_codon:yes stop_codon:yes gene_type:complete